MLAFERSSNFAPSENSPVLAKDLKWFRPGQRGIPWRLSAAKQLVNILSKFGIECTLHQHLLQPCQEDLQVLIVSPQGYDQTRGRHGMHGVDPKTERHIYQRHGGSRRHSMSSNAYLIIAIKN